jgi:sulfite exporter TauE/SafE
MTEHAPKLAALISLLVAGLAGSLHCIGMCGPILVGYAQVFQRSRLTVNGKALDADADGAAAPARGPSLFWDFTAYHLGRLWVYAMLGLLAGFVGQSVRQGAGYLQWQKPASIAISAAVILSGVMLLGIVPGLRLDNLAGECGQGKLARIGWLQALLRGQGPLPRLLLGAAMGLLPCGLIYSTLVAASAMPNPLWSALGMLAFGIGTLPSLTTAVMAGRLIPATWRRHGSAIAAVVIIVMGSYMLTRSVLVEPPAEGDTEAACPWCATQESP